MKYKHIEASREARLWLGQVIVPTVVGALAVMSNSEARFWIANKASTIKGFVKNKFSR